MKDQIKQQQKLLKEEKKKFKHLQKEVDKMAKLMSADDDDKDKEEEEDDEDEEETESEEESESEESEEDEESETEDEDDSLEGQKNSLQVGTCKDCLIIFCSHAYISNVFAEAS